MNTPFALSKIHHVAYRCRDAKQTVEFYNTVLGMEYLSAFSEDHVPSTGEYDPYMHVFLDAGGGNVIAFFELPNQPDMTRDSIPRNGCSISRSRLPIWKHCLQPRRMSRRRALR